MAKFPFTDSDGQIFYHDPDKVRAVETGFVVVKKDNDILCLRNEIARIYTLPAQSEVTLEAEPSGEFSIISYVIRSDEPVKEEQNYKVYEVKNVDLKDTPLEWVSLSDILLGNVAFDATLKNGMKNLLVRGK